MAELTKLITFVSGEDKDVIIQHYSRMLDEAEDEQAMLDSFGSPTKLAVTIFRSYSRGEYKFDEEAAVEEVAEEPTSVETVEEPAAEEIAEEPASVETVEEPAPEEVAEEPAPEEVAEEPAPEEVAEEVPHVDERLESLKQLVGDSVPVEILQQLLKDPAPEVEPEAAPEVEPEAAPEVEPEAAPEVEPEAAPEVEPEADTVIEPEEKTYDDGEETVVENLRDDEGPETKVRVFPLILYLIFAIPVGLALVLILAGIGLGFLAVSCLVFGIGCRIMGFSFSGLQLMGDRFIVFGAGLAVLAISIVLLWFTLWLMIISYRALFRGIIGLGRKWCVKEVQANG